MKREKIALVLGSGGARGYAHIGVIEEFSKYFDIVAISGSSMGALIGGLYACNKLDEYKNWVLGLDVVDVVKLLDFSFSSKGFISGEKVFGVIERMIGNVMIEELPLSYTAVAVDITKKREVWFQKGNLLDAIRASIAIPTIFTPKEIDGSLYVDGGVLNPLPIAPTFAHRVDKTIAVNLGAKAQKIDLSIPKKELEKENRIKKGFIELMQNVFEKKEKSISLFGIMTQTIDIMQEILLECKMRAFSCDYIIDIPVNVCDFYEFHKAYEIIEFGRNEAKKALKELLE